MTIERRSRDWLQDFADFHHFYPHLDPLDLTLARFLGFLNRIHKLPSVKVRPPGEYDWMEASAERAEQRMIVEEQSPE